MKNLLLLLLVQFLAGGLCAQYVYTIKADSVKITGCDSSELIIENHTQDIKGFLFNSGNGRTLFRKGLIRINDSLYLIGADTLKVTPSNFWSLNGNAGTVDGVHFIGTTDATPLNFRMNNQPAGRVDSVNAIVSLGYRAGNASAGFENVALGNRALQNNTGPDNIGIGTSALAGNTNGDDNIAIGHHALESNQSGEGNIAIGSYALYAPTFSGVNTAIGYGSMGSSSGAYNSTAVGAFSLAYNTDGGDLVAIGHSSMFANTTGSQNTAIGVYTLESNTTGQNNNAMGWKALDGNTTGNENVAIGNLALEYNSTGGYNTAVGNYALGTGSGSYNTALGWQAAVNSNLGTNNTVVGANSGGGITFGNNNTVLGANVALSNYAGIGHDNNVLIGDGAGNVRIWIDANGNFMTGTIVPLARHTFTGSGTFTDTLTATTMGNTDSSNRVATTAWVKRQGFGGVAFNGVLNSSLAVNGPVRAKSLTLSADATGWPDYVFDSSYQLPDLHEVQQYIQVHRHLPGMPSAGDVAGSGINVGENQAVLLQKIEELTLYAVGQQEQLVEQKRRLDRQEKQLAQREAQMNRLLERLDRLEVALQERETPLHWKATKK